MDGEGKTRGGRKGARENERGMKDREGGKKKVDRPRGRE